MARYRDDLYDDRDFSNRSDRSDRSDRINRFERERPWNYNETYAERTRDRVNYNEPGSLYGRFGERAGYEPDEPRYSGNPSDRYRQAGYGSGYGDERGYDRPYAPRRQDAYAPARSRLRARDIMTRDLAVASRDTALREVAAMMKEEDTGVIPVVDFLTEGNGTEAHPDRRTGSFNYGKLIGLVTDRDIVLRAVADDKDSRTTRAEEIMSNDLITAKPNDRIVDIIRRMGDKQVRRIPVVSENGYLRGMISLGDVAVETEADRELAEALEDISKESSFWSRIFG